MITSHSPRSYTNLPRWTLTHTSLYDIPHIDLLHLFRFNPSFLHRMFDRDDTKLRSGERCEGTIDGTDGRTRS